MAVAEVVARENVGKTFCGNFHLHVLHSSAHGYLAPKKSIALIRKQKCSGNVNSKLIFNVSDGVAGKIKGKKKGN